MPQSDPMLVFAERSRPAQPLQAPVHSAEQNLDVVSPRKTIRPEIGETTSISAVSELMIPSMSPASEADR